jgi:molybdopterin synthase catalytic subunit
MAEPQPAQAVDAMQAVGAVQVGESAAVGAVRFVGISIEPLSVDEVLAAVADPSAGGTALFVGTVRAVDDGQPVVPLSTRRIPTP